MSVDGKKMKIKNILVAVIFICIGLLITACSRKAYVDASGPTESNSESAVETNLSIEEATASSDEGYYSIEGYANHTVIAYIDYQTCQQIVLCANPQCQHNSESCTAFISDEVRREPVSLLVVNQRLILFQLSASQNISANIQSLDLNGQDPKVICTFPSSWDIDPRIYQDGNNLYFLCSSIDSTSGTYSESLVKVNLDSGDKKVVMKLPDNTKSVLQGSFSNFIWMTTSHSENQKYYVDSYLVDINAGELDEPVVSIESNTLGMLMERECLYLVDDDSKTIQIQDMVTKAIREISFADIAEDAGEIGDTMAFVMPPIENKVIIWFGYNDDFRYYLMDLNTEEWIPFTLRNKCRTNEMVSVIQVLDDELLVIMDWTLVSDEFGITDTIPQYALISKEDYFASQANYKLIKPLC